MTDWTFEGNWPFEPKWFKTPGGRLHYIDEGPTSAPPIVMVHGNPTWSYVYRDFVRAAINVGFRAITVDHLGFGRSAKPSDSSLYAIEEHPHRFRALMLSLEIRSAILVVQDWGGPIGLPWAANFPNRVHGLFVLNTFFHRPAGKVPLPLIIRACRLPILGELLVKGLHLFVRDFLFQAGLSDPSQLSPVDRKAYLAPHPTWGSRTGVLAFPRQIPSGPIGPVSDFVDREGRKLQSAFADKPVHICWPLKDVAFTKEVLADMWLKSFPKAGVTTLENAGHFVQEDATAEVVIELLRFANKVRSTHAGVSSIGQSPDLSRVSPFLPIVDR